MKNEISLSPKKEEMINWIMTICDKGYRRPGSPASHKVEQFLVDELKSFGFEDVHKQTIDIPLWEPKKWQFTFKTENKIYEVPCFYACYTTFTDLNGVTITISITNRSMIKATTRFQTEAGALKVCALGKPLFFIFLCLNILDLLNFPF